MIASSNLFSEPARRSYSYLVRVASVALIVAQISSTIGRGERFPDSSWQKAMSPVEAGWSEERLAEAREFSETIDTAAVMVIHDGLVVDEWGFTALPLRCHSVRKSLLSALFGIHVDEGTIDLDRTLEEIGIDDNQPSLTKIERRARIGDLLKARSGVYHPALFETPRMAKLRPKRGSHQPDTFWYYNNWDFNSLGTIFENLTGSSLFEEFENRLADPLEMQDFVRRRHTRYVTGQDSVHPAYPFQLSTRDLARVGLLFLRQGWWKNRQLVPAKWVSASTQSYSNAGESGGYGYMWWVAADGKHLPSIAIPDGSFSARGYRGQHLVVIPKWDIVIVHRVNSFQEGNSVPKADFGKLLRLILAARPLSDGKTDEIQSEQAARRTETLSANDSGFDTLLRGGRVIDGTGRKAFHADVAIRDGRIAAIGNLQNKSTARVIDVSNRIVAPGFIDLHSYADGGLTSADPQRRSAPNLITQGITTVVVNQDGRGPASILEQRRNMQRLGIGLNVVQMIGHGSIRHAVMQDNYRRPATAAEIGQMRKLIRQGMQEGARGLSAGLEYVPGRWSTPHEMESLGHELAVFDGVYIVHERSSGSRPMWFLPSRHDPLQPSMLDNLRELIDIASATKITAVATHIKARGVDFWGSSQTMIQMIEKARSSGVSIYADQYPYNTSGSDGRIVLIPDWIESRLKAGSSDKQDQANQSGNGGVDDKNTKRQRSTSNDKTTPARWLEIALDDQTMAADVRRDIRFEITRRGGGENILVLEHPNSEYVGKTLAEVANRLGYDEVEMAIRFQLDGYQEQPGGARLRAFSMSEKDVETLAARAWIATSSDAGIALPTDGPVHPRFYGAFPRKIRRYAIERELISLETAVQVSTSLPARILKLHNRGTLKPGAHADLVVFDPKRIRDTADAFQPHRYCEGVEYVLVGAA